MQSERTKGRRRRATSFSVVQQAAMKWLRRYLDEKEPTLREFAALVRSLDERQLNET